MLLKKQVKNLLYGNLLELTIEDIQYVIDNTTNLIDCYYEIISALIETETFYFQLPNFDYLKNLNLFMLEQIHNRINTESLVKYCVEITVYKEYIILFLNPDYANIPGLNKN